MAGLCKTHLNCSYAGIGWQVTASITRVALWFNSGSNQHQHQHQQRPQQQDSNQPANATTPAAASQSRPPPAPPSIEAVKFPASFCHRRGGSGWSCQYQHDATAGSVGGDGARVTVCSTTGGVSAAEPGDQQENAV